MIRRKLIIILILLSTFCSFPQTPRVVRIAPQIDTANDDFKGVYIFWEKYMDQLCRKNARKGGLMDEMDTELKSYWDQNEIDNYKFVDLYYAYMSSIGNVLYPFDKEYFLGVSKRDKDLFELKTMFISKEDGYFKGFPTLLITVPVRKINGSYKLINKFSLNKSQLQTKAFSNITYYYPPNYHFNDSSASQLNIRIEEFKKNFQINDDAPFTYLSADNKTEISKWLGIDYYCADFISASNTVQAGYITSNRIILSGGGGESYLHEIIHLLLSKFDRGNYMYFEEGIACYFGEHIQKPYTYNIVPFKDYLQKNQWIDLSQSLYGYLKNGTGEIYYNPEFDESSMKLIRYRDTTSTYNFQYMIHAVICDIAFKKGGYPLVRELYLAKADHERDFCNNVANILGIRKEDLNSYLRDFINSNY
jgi:hypothetical protein